MGHHLTDNMGIMDKDRVAIGGTTLLVFDEREACGINYGDKIG